MLQAGKYDDHPADQKCNFCRRIELKHLDYTMSLIEEGFNSFDPATLKIAMDALDRLINHGGRFG